MRKILFAFIAVLLFVSCEDNSSTNVSISEQDIAGTWKLTKMYSENAKVTIKTSAGVSLSFDVELKSKDHKNSTTTFESNPNKLYENGSLVLVSKYNIRGKVETNEQEVVANPSLKTDWSLSNGNTLKLSLQNLITTKKEVSGTITDFDPNNLKLKIVISEDYNFPSNLGLEISDAKIDGTIYLTYTK